MTRRATEKRFVDILTDLERTVALMRGLLAYPRNSHGEFSGAPGAPAAHPHHPSGGRGREFLDSHLLDSKDGVTWDVIARRLRSHAYYIERLAGRWPSRARGQLKAHR